jgi:hypothetical protein
MAPAPLGSGATLDAMMGGPGPQSPYAPGYDASGPVALPGAPGVGPTSLLEAAGLQTGGGPRAPFTEEAIAPDGAFYLDPERMHEWNAQVAADLVRGGRSGQDAGQAILAALAGGGAATDRQVTDLQHGAGMPHGSTIYGTHEGLQAQMDQALAVQASKNQAASRKPLARPKPGEMGTYLDYAGVEYGSAEFAHFGRGVEERMAAGESALSAMSNTLGMMTTADGNQLAWPKDVLAQQFMFDGPIQGKAEAWKRADALMLQQRLTEANAAGVAAAMAAHGDYDAAGWLADRIKRIERGEIIPIMPAGGEAPRVVPDEGGLLDAALPSLVPEPDLSMGVGYHQQALAAARGTGEALMQTPYVSGPVEMLRGAANKAGPMASSAVDAGKALWDAIMGADLYDQSGRDAIAGPPRNVEAEELARRQMFRQRR